MSFFDHKRHSGRATILALGTVLLTTISLHALQAIGAHVTHAHQADFATSVQNGRHGEAFKSAYQLGDTLFDTRFHPTSGGGAKVVEGLHYTRIPRADLSASGEWATHLPPRTTGPNARSCAQCHRESHDEVMDSSLMLVYRDPTRSGIAANFIKRDSPHLSGLGAIQRLAEEMTEELHKARNDLVARVCRKGGAEHMVIKAKGISFGAIGVTRTSRAPCTVDIDTSKLEGVDEDLVIKPLQWKGTRRFVRAFSRDAAHNEIGMQAVEIVGDGVDGDGDGVADELTVGDITAMSIYLAALPRPVSRLELNELDLLTYSLSNSETRDIHEGNRIFNETGCSECHTPNLKISNPVFSEPSRHPDFRDAVFPAGQNPVARKVDPNLPVTFDLTRDQQANIITGRGGGIVRLGSFETNRRGQAIVRLYSDLKRHDMGPRLAESIDESGTGASVWLTRPLWGVGSTPPYLHDGSAATLSEAILSHGGEAQSARDKFTALPVKARNRLITFLNNLVLYRAEEQTQDTRGKIQAKNLYSGMVGH